MVNVINFAWRNSTGSGHATSVFLVVCLIFLFGRGGHPGISITVLYIIVVHVSSKFLSTRSLAVISASCAALTFVEFYLACSAQDAWPGSAWASCLLGIAAILVTGSLAVQNRAMTLGLIRQVQMLAQTHDAIIVRDLLGQITYWNPGATALFGWSREEALGAICYRLLGMLNDRSVGAIKKHLLEFGHWEGEQVANRRDGRQVYVSTRWTLQRDLEGRPVAILSASNDVSERKMALDALHRSQMFLTGAQRLSDTGSIGFSLDEEGMFWSDEAARIFGFTAPQSPPGQQPGLTDLYQRVHPEEREAVERVFQDAGRRAALIEIEFRLVLPQDLHRHVRMRANPIGDAGRNLEYVGAVMDITRARRAEEALHKSRADLAHVTRMTTLGELAASITHEVKQPLAAIRINGEASLRWLDRTTPDLAEVRSALVSMIADTVRADQVIQRIRGLVRKKPPERTRIDLNDLLDDTLALLRRELQQQHISLTFRRADAALALRADRVQLQQVFINLLVNAIQAMSTEPGQARELLVETRCPDTQQMVVEVRDNGPGIPPVHLPFVFDAFFSTRDEGMGMGLSICRSIVEAHGGQISAINLPTGGAAMILTLPTTGPCAEEILSGMQSHE